MNDLAKLFKILSKENAAEITKEKFEFYGADNIIEIEEIEQDIKKGNMESTRTRRNKSTAIKV